MKYSTKKKIALAVCLTGIGFYTISMVNTGTLVKDQLPNERKEYVLTQAEEENLSWRNIDLKSVGKPFDETKLKRRPTGKDIIDTSNYSKI